MFDIPWRCFQAISWDAIVSFFQHLIQNATPRVLPSDGVPVFVMLPLDTALPTRQLSSETLHDYLQKLASIGVHGVMVDIWWGICEPTPETYDFSYYIELAKTCRSLSLKLQAVMSFHACGGNVGDSVNIPLPSWVISAGDEHGFWFTDGEGNINREYISIGADYESVLPSGINENEPSSSHLLLSRLRTPLQAYHGFTKAFVNAMEEEGLMGVTITELQIGLGPCGELRYPSYPMSKWTFPGIGEFQCFDKYLKQDLEANIRERGCDEIKQSTMPPINTGTYNDRPSKTKFFTHDMYTKQGDFFLRWYSDRLLEHAEDVLGQIRNIIPKADGTVKIALKISGIHWWTLSKSRAAEATAGYIGGGGGGGGGEQFKKKKIPIYQDLCKLLACNDVILDFTCLEMRSIDQPLWARCGPRQLVNQVFECASRENVSVAGENALQDFSEKAFRQIVWSLRGTRARKSGFTLLRLCDELMEDDNFGRFEKFVVEMKGVDLSGKT